MKSRFWFIPFIVLIVTLALSACNGAETPIDETEDASSDVGDVEEDEAGDGEASERVEEAVEAPAAEQPVQITGTVEVSNMLIVEVYFLKKHLINQSMKWMKFT